MAAPTHTAQAITAQDERVAQVLMALETAPAASIHAAPLVVLSTDRPPRPLLGLHAGGRSWALSREDALITARALADDPAGPHSASLAAGLREGVYVTDLLVLRSRMQMRRAGDVEA